MRIPFLYPALGVATLGVAACAVVMVAALALAPKAAAKSDGPLSWDTLDLTALDGGRLDPGDFQGRVVLVVNTASRCAFTPQYDDLEALWDRYRGQGLVILGVPSNDFGNQEPGSNAEIAAFCASTYGVSFPMTAKASVTGANAHPIFAWARRVGGASAVPGWNFHKLVIDRDGRLAATFPSYQKPSSAAVTGAIEQALAAPPTM